MLSNRSVTTPALTLSPSRYLAIYLIAIHGLALTVLMFPLSIPVPILILIPIMVLFSFIRAWRNREPITAVRAPAEDGLWHLQTRQGQTELATLGENFVTPWLIAMRFKTLARKNYNVVVLPDSGAGDEIRRMRVYLRQLKTGENENLSGKILRR